MKIILLNCLLILLASCASTSEGFDLKSEVELSKEIKSKWPGKNLTILEVKQSIHKDKIRITYKHVNDPSEKFKVFKIDEFNKTYHIYLEETKGGKLTYIDIDGER